MIGHGGHSQRYHRPPHPLGNGTLLPSQVDKQRAHDQDVPQENIVPGQVKKVHWVLRKRLGIFRGTDVSPTGRRHLLFCFLTKRMKRLWIRISPFGKIKKIVDKRPLPRKAPGKALGPLACNPLQGFTKGL